MIAGGILMAFGLILLVVKCLFFRKPIYEDEDDEDEMMTEKEAAAALDKKTVKSSTGAKNGESVTSNMKQPHLAITITPASDGSQTATRSGNECAEKKIDIECSNDNRNNIKMQEMQSVKTKDNSVVATSVDNSTTTNTKKNVEKHNKSPCPV